MNFRDNSDIFIGAIDLIKSLDDDYTYFNSKRNKEIGFQNPLYLISKNERNSSIESRQLTDSFNDKQHFAYQKVNMKICGLRWSVRAGHFATYKKLQNIFMPYIVLFGLMVILILVFKVEIFLGNGSEFHKKKK